MKMTLIKVYYALCKVYKKTEADRLLEELLRIIFG